MLNDRGADSGRGHSFNSSFVRTAHTSGVTYSRGEGEGKGEGDREWEF